MLCGSVASSFHGELLEKLLAEVDEQVGSVVVPPGATHLFLSTTNTRFDIWFDPDGDYGVRITLERRATPDD